MPPTPLIAISPNRLPPEDRRFYKHKGLEYGEVGLARAVLDAGGLPVTVCLAERPGGDGAASAPNAIAAHATAIMERADGLLLSGGDDIAPEHYGEVAQHEAWRGDTLRDAFELALFRASLALGKPVLGVCRGAQLIGVAEGGSLWQDLPSLRPESHAHRSQELYDALGHGLEFAADSFVAGFFDGDERWVNSVHHQGLKVEPPTLEVVARAPDGLAEAYVRTASGPWVLGVQWHPEWMQAHASARRVFARFVQEARA